MQYKVRFRPMERLTRSGWQRISVQEHDHLVSVAANVRRNAAPAVDGGNKDGIPGGQGQYRLV
jgi:arginine-tRNA-protein transferase